MLAYALSWAWWLPIAVSGGSVARGDAWPTHLPGLLGPLIAALVVLAVTEGRAGVRRWLGAMVLERRWQLAAVAPFAFLALGLGVVAVTGDVPPAEEFIQYSGTAASVGALVAAVFVNVFGEEAGWRGYALPRLQSRLGPMRATLGLAALWAGWHAPLFFILASYGDFNPLILPGFFIGLAAGAFASLLRSVRFATGAHVFGEQVNPVANDHWVRAEFAWLRFGRRDARARMR